MHKLLARRKFRLLKATKVHRDTPRILKVVLPTLLRFTKFWLVESLLRDWRLFENERLERVRAIRIIHRSVVYFVEVISLIKALDSAGYVRLDRTMSHGSPTMELLLLESLVDLVIDAGLLCRFFILFKLNLILLSFSDLGPF